MSSRIFPNGYVCGESICTGIAWSFYASQKNGIADMGPGVFRSQIGCTYTHTKYNIHKAQKNVSYLEMAFSIPTILTPSTIN